MDQLFKRMYTTICRQKLVFLAKVSFGLYWVYCKPYEKFKFWHTYDLLSSFIPYTVYPLLSYKRLCTDKNIDLISVSHNSVTVGTS